MSKRDQVRLAIGAFVSRHRHDESEIDLLRLIREESIRLYERQRIWDALDADPLGAFHHEPPSEEEGGGLDEANDDEDLKRIKERLKELLHVIDYDETTTSADDGGEGECTTMNATVELRPTHATTTKPNEQSKETLKMMLGDEVSDHIQLRFHYERRPMPTFDHGDVPLPFRQEQKRHNKEDQSNVKRHSNRQGNEPGTHLTYFIELSKDYGKRERLLTVEVWAQGRGASRTCKPLPLPEDEENEDDWEDFDEEEGDEVDTPTVRGSPVASPRPKAKRMRHDSIAMSEPLPEGNPEAEANKDDDHDDATSDDPIDYFASYVDPEVMANFMFWSRIGTDEMAAFLFLMTFPYYEHEWDLVGFVIETVFDGGEKAGVDDALEVIEFDENGNEVTE